MRTQYERMRCNSITGEPVKATFTGYYNEGGVLELKSTGIVNVYERIQADKDSADINVIMKRYLNGDTEVINRVQGQYIDTTIYPKTLMESLNTVMQVERDFNKLPVDIKEKFNNSYTEFMAQFGTEGFSEKLGIKKVEEEIKEEVNKE